MNEERVKHGVAAFKKIAKQINSNEKINSHEYEEELEARVKQIELTKTLQQIDSRADERKTKVDSTFLVREDRER